jgi:TonB family protein
MAKSPWRILGIPAGSDRATIRRAYARLLKKTNPEDDPDGFMALRAAYDAALQQADWREGQGSGPDGAEDDDADAAIPVEPPAAQPTTADPDQAAVDELIARQEALVALLAQQGAGRDELLAAVDHVLTAPLAERIDVRAGLEDWLGRMLVEFRPASDPLVVPLVDRFGWDDLPARQRPWHIDDVLRRRDEGQFVNAMARPYADLHQAYQALTAAGLPGWRRRLTALSGSVRADVQRVFNSMDSGLLGVADWLNADAMAWWRNFLSQPRLGWDELALAPLLLLAVWLVGAAADDAGLQPGLLLASLLSLPALAAPWAALHWVARRRRAWLAEPWKHPDWHWRGWQLALAALVLDTAVMVLLPGPWQGVWLFGLLGGVILVLGWQAVAVPPFAQGLPARLWGIVRTIWPLAVLGLGGLPQLPLALGTGWFLATLALGIGWWRGGDALVDGLVALLPRWRLPLVHAGVIGLALASLALLAGAGWLLPPVAGLFLDKLGLSAASILLFAAYRLLPPGWWRFLLFLAWPLVLAAHFAALDRLDGQQPPLELPTVTREPMVMRLPDTPPRPLTDPKTWVVADDLSKVWPDAGGRFSVTVDLAVASNGQVAGCAIVQSSGLPAMDKASCAALQRRARFAPARRDDGQPVPGLWQRRITWVVPPLQRPNAQPAPVLRPVACPADTRPQTASPAVPCLPRQWANGDDYPADALAAGQQGRVGFTLDIDVKGQVTGCHVDASSGGKLLDAGTCRIIRARARFLPARDADGQPVPGEYADSIRWRITG